MALIVLFAVSLVAASFLIDWSKRKDWKATELYLAWLEFRSLKFVRAIADSGLNPLHYLPEAVISGLALLAFFFAADLNRWIKPQPGTVPTVGDKAIDWTQESLRGLILAAAAFFLLQALSYRKPTEPEEIQAR